MRTETLFLRIRLTNLIFPIQNRKGLYDCKNITKEFYSNGF